VIGIGNAMISINCNQYNTANSQSGEHTSVLEVGKVLCICDVAALPKEKEKLCFRERYRATCPSLFAVYVFVSVVCCMLSLPSPSHLFQHTSVPTLHCHTATQTTLAQCSYMVRLLRSYRKENQDTLPQTSACCATAATLAIIAVLAALVAPLSRDY
jgi:hypothetical protein